MNKETKLGPTILYLIGGVLLSRIATTLIVPFMTLFLHVYLGISIGSAGTIVALSYFSNIMGGFIGGNLSDHLGRRFLIIVSLGLYAVVFISYGLAFAFVHSIFTLEILIALLSIILGISRSWFESLLQAMIADVCPNEQKRYIFQLRYIFANIGSVLGALCGALLGIVGTIYGFYVSAIIFIFYLVFFIIFTKSNSVKNANSHSFKEVGLILLKDKAMRNFTLAGGLIYFGCVQQETLLAVIINLNVQNKFLFPVLLAFNAFTIVMLQVPFGKFFNQIPLFKSVALGVSLMAVGLIIIGLSGKIISLYIIAEIVFTLGEMCVLPLTGVVIDMIAPANLRGSYYGASTFQYIGRGLGPIVGGYLLQNSNSSITMCIIAIIFSCSIFFYYFTLKEIKKLGNENFKIIELHKS